MNNLLTYHFKNELTKLGYPDLTVEYSLGYCQGDGVDFFGNLRVCDVADIMKRLFDASRTQGSAVHRVKNLLAQKDIGNMLSVLSDSGYDWDVSIDRNMKIDSTVTFRSIDPADDEFLGDAAKDLDEMLRAGWRETTERWQEIWERFLDELKEEVQTLSRQLKSDGYRLLEATPYEETVVWERNTRTYLVRVTELPVGEVHFCDLWDKGVRDDIIRGLLNGDERILGLRVEVLCRENGAVLGSHSLHELVIARDDRSYAHYRRDLLKDAVRQARELAATFRLRKAVT